MANNEHGNNQFKINKFFKLEPGYPKIEKDINLPENPPVISGFSAEELAEMNQAILNDISTKINKDKFTAFFDNSLTIKGIDSNNIYFFVPSSFVKKIVTEQFLSFIDNAVVQTLGIRYNIIIETPGMASASSIKESAPIEPTKKYNVNRSSSVKGTTFSINDDDFLPSFSKSDLEAKVEAQVLSEQDSNLGKSIDLKKTFENFVVGPSNNLAHASSVAVSKGPGQIYSSLYIHGNSGLGKTHLLHAVANKISETHPSSRIFITTANEFMSEMISAIQAQDIQSFRRKYSEMIDVLMIDDIHELKNKPGTQNEFFHVFNELQRKKKQLIFTSDKDPKDITGIEDRIRTRLSSALVVEIQQPDLETRIAILKRKAIEEDIYLPDDVVNLIASCIKSNIRELEGSLIKLGAYSSVFNVDIDLETAKEQLKLNIEDEKKTVNIETITKTVSNFYKIPVPDIRSKARMKEVTMARHIAMYFSYYLAKATLMEIGSYFGKRDHTSVMHGVNKIKTLSKDSEFSQKLYEIESLL